MKQHWLDIMARSSTSHFPSDMPVCVDDEAEQHSAVAGADRCLACNAGLFSNITGAWRGLGYLIYEQIQCPVHALLITNLKLICKVYRTLLL
jgi:hypothetical protein